MDFRATVHNWLSLVAIRYRSSDVYLAVKPATELDEPGGFLFYAGGLDKPAWSPGEEDAAPLFGEGCVGELSVR
jgi:hypothetical protein